MATGCSVAMLSAVVSNTCHATRPGDNRAAAQVA